MMFRLLLASYAILQCTTALLMPSEDQTTTCSLKNDPLLTTFYDEHLKLAPVPCMSLVTEGSTEVFQNVVLFGTNEELISNQRIKAGVCSFKVLSYNVRVKGKMYQGGYRVLINFWSELDGIDNKKIGLAAHGRGEGGQYTYTIESSLDQTNWADFDPASGRDYGITGDMVSFDLDDETNLLSLDYRDCGVKINFRAADINATVFEQPATPGLSVIVDNEGSVSDNFDTTLCLKPHVSLSDVRIRRLTDQANFLVRSLARRELVQQDFPGASDMCSTIQDTVRTCFDKGTALSKKALDRCSQLLQRDGFIGCYSKKNPDTNGDSILRLFDACLQGECRLGKSLSRKNNCSFLSKQIEDLHPSCSRRIADVFSEGTQCSKY